MPHIFAVGELARALKNVLESQFPFVFVRGQVSNLSRPASGHIYFTLKDDEAALSVVWFKGSQASSGGGFDPLTGEVFEEGESARNVNLADGQEVMCGGRITFYPPRGTLQMVTEVVQDLGAGQLYLEFEALKRELAAKGYFDAGRKRAIPRNPARVALVTSPTGAAVRDFIRVATPRGFGCEIRVYPAVVQGDAAPASIVAAMNKAVTDGFAELIVLARGGGSIEDLWAFNTAAVAEAIFTCPLPVATGVGHEIDTTIADLVADLRAATPSHAAQLLWVERETLVQAADEAETALTRAARAYLARKSQALSSLETRLAWLSPVSSLARLSETLSGLRSRLAGAAQRLVSASEFSLASLTSRLSSACRQGIDAKEREFALLAARLEASFGPRTVREREHELISLTQRLGRGAAQFLKSKQAGLDVLDAHLTALDPRGPLARGYSLVRVDRTGKLLYGPGQAAAGDALTITARDGEVAAVVAAKNVPGGHGNKA